MRSIFLAAIAAALLTACGTKGPLTLPPPPDTIAKPAATPVDNSSKPPAGILR